jgi:hypothetical protein
VIHGVFVSKTTVFDTQLTPSRGCSFPPCIPRFSSSCASAESNLFSPMIRSSWSG